MAQYYNPYYTNMQPQGESSKFSSWWKDQDKMAGVTAGLSAGAANNAGEDDFSIDPNAGFKGSGQGLMSGGVVGAIVGGVGAQVGQFSRVNKNLKNLQTGVEGVNYDEYGRPSYGGENVAGAMQTMQQLEAGQKAINKSIDPATRVFSGLFGTKRKLRKAQRQIQQSIASAQKNYNEADVTFRNQANAMEDYYEKMQNRPFNLYQ